MMPARTEQQRRADRYFGAETAYWQAIYADKDVMSTIYQLRREVVLDMVDRLALPKDARILEVGCGAGLTSVELARRGYTVDAIDSVEEMLAAARRHAEEANLTEHVRTNIGDVYDLQFADNTYDLVIAMGVIPWLHSPHEAMREMRRVAKEHGRLIVTADNKWRLNHLLDPRLTPLLNPAKKAIKSLVRFLGPGTPIHRGARVYMYSGREVRHMIRGVNLTQLHWVTLGFGPFSFLGKLLFSDQTGVRMHRFLQHLADRRIPGIRSTGSHYVILAQKPGLR